MHSTFTALFTIVLSTTLGFAQNLIPDKADKDSIMIRSIYDEALVNGQSYENLRSLCKDVGSRLSGSPEAEKAVEWGKQVLDSLKFDKVYLQPIDVPFWERGDREFAAIKANKNMSLDIKTLGGSVATNGRIEAEVVEVQGLEEVKQLGREKLEGKIVFYNRPMDPRPISTFESYGGCVDQRYWGAVEAAQQGAIAVMVRSMTLLDDHAHAHTGSMGYKEGVTKIPSVALSTQSANQLHRQLESGGATVILDINPRTNENVKSFNVIGEITGKTYPDKIITVGGHLDSWDVGEGAHDDGAGIAHSIEALRILKSLQYQPHYTLRVVLFMNEENGNMGGKGYAAKSKEKNEFHLAAIETDRGGFSPRGFSIKPMNENQVGFIQQFAPLLKDYQLHHFEAGYAGVDINPLAEEKNIVNPDMFMLGLVPDSQRYFDFHHCDDDVFENVNKRELELGCAAIASMIYLLDQHVKQLK
ncbi:MAG: M20/M25/M40 family metallo-hydrolase [Bacteroidia bacterium]|nr:M20/M25/M40 family metallo-hydrolase [Bacteroidia bacterium]